MTSNPIRLIDVKPELKKKIDRPEHSRIMHGHIRSVPGRHPPALTSSNMQRNTYNAPQHSHRNRESSSSNGRDRAAEHPYDKSDCRIIRDGGLENKKQFMESYNLRIYNPEDFEEANTILDGFRKINTQNYEMKHGMCNYSSNQYTPSRLPPYEQSDYRIIREGGWDDMKHFMDSFDLRKSSLEDHEEAKSILDGFRRVDAQQNEVGLGYEGRLEELDDEEYHPCGEDYYDGNDAEGADPRRSMSEEHLGESRDDYTLGPYEWRYEVSNGRYVEAPREVWQDGRDAGAFQEPPYDGEYVESKVDCGHDGAEYYEQGGGDFFDAGYDDRGYDEGGFDTCGGYDEEGGYDEDGYDNWEDELGYNE